MNFWTSDQHYGHRNIITYSGRPFRTADGQPDLEAMNRTMVDRWNAVVSPTDQVFVLGDFSMHKEVSKIRAIRERLHGHIVLVRGNHDRSTQQMHQAGFDEVYDRLETTIDGHRLYMSHIPVTISDPHPRKYKPCFTEKPPAYYDYWLCGHVHELWRRRGKVINVGVDQWDFTPRRLEELLTATETPPRRP
jgi:calcineurin-like phosphoesterase family protein